MPIDRNDPERLLIRREEQAARPRQQPPQRAWPESQFHIPHAGIPFRQRHPMRTLDLTHSTASGLEPPPATPGTPPEPEKPSSMPPDAGKRPSNVLAGKSLKCTVVVSPADVAAIAVRDGQPRVLLRIEVAARTLTAYISAKSVRRAIVAIHEHGVDGVTAILQGKLVGDRIEECGLAVQPKTPKPPAEAAC